ncbi:MAG TPA: protein-disulfide reductase DsbD domain-containing protein [Lacipirellulaceae bacterium]|nr:protein-disulfide reductase DsbD domain-containing protein [Lacipirellulaceae bacterium]
MVFRPSEAQAGETVDVIVQVRIAGAHYLHAGSHATFTPVSMDIELPEVLEAKTDWRLPTPEKGRGGELVYRDSIILQRSLRILSDASPEEMIVRGELRYQACNDELCWPPGTLDLSASLKIERR